MNYFDVFDERPQNEPITNCKSIESAIFPVMRRIIMVIYTFRLYTAVIYIILCTRREDRPRTAVVYTFSAIRRGHDSLFFYFLRSDTVVNYKSPCSSYLLKIWFLVFFGTRFFV